ncbi:MAG: hypothetical protein ACYCO9_21430, partial [Streptosporangiaceae bacterium]
AGATAAQAGEATGPSPAGHRPGADEALELPGAIGGGGPADPGGPDRPPAGDTGPGQGKEPEL